MDPLQMLMIGTYEFSGRTSPHELMHMCPLEEREINWEISSCSWTADAIQPARERSLWAAQWLSVAESNYELELIRPVNHYHTE